MIKRSIFAAAMVFILFSGSNVLAGQSQFEHKLLSLTLPDGWSVNKATVTGDELIGSLQSTSIPGSSILIYAYRGMTLNYRNIRIRGLKSIADTYPQGQVHLKKPKSIKTDSGYKPKYELWQGFIDAGGTTVALQSPMAAMKTKRAWILMIGYTPDTTGVQMEQDFIKILKSAE